MHNTPHIFTTTDAAFAGDVLQSPTPVLVDFWGEWCPPCKALAPLLEQIAAEYGGRLKIAKVEIDTNQKTSLAYGVRSAPTMLLFKDGKVQATQTGLVSKAQLAKVIDAVPCGIINVHPGTLPSYRGLFAPFWQILHREPELGCSVHLVDRGIDTGPILGIARVPFDPTRSLMWHTAALYRSGVRIATDVVGALARGATPNTAVQPADGRYFRFPAAEDFAALRVRISSPLDYAELLEEAFLPAGAIPPVRAA